MSFDHLQIYEKENKKYTIERTCDTVLVFFIFFFFDMYIEQLILSIKHKNNFRILSVKHS